MKVLIISSKFGMGHLAAARALAQQIESSSVPAQVIMADIFELTLPRQSRLLYDGYTALTTRTTKIYNMAYKKATSFEHGHHNKRHTIEKYMLKKLAAYVQGVAPDVVVTTYSLAARFMADYKRRYDSSLPLVTCITDISIHDVWTNQDTDLYLVAAEETKQALCERGIAAERIAICGIPVAEVPQLTIPHNNGCKELLVMGGGLGLLPNDLSFYRQLSDIPRVHTTVICGKNKMLFRRLRAAGLLNIEILGFSDCVPYYLRRADAVLTKTGGISTFEAIAAEVPVIAFKPVLEQEAYNSRYIESQQMGMILEQKATESVLQISALLENDQRLNLYRNNMQRVKAQLQKSALVDFLSQISQQKVVRIAI